jgi:4-amino-4-deoxy-L-arabinose transferase-like glycosyltransferase
VNDAKLRTAAPFALVLIVYLLVASSYSIVTPILEASDELWHYPMVKTVADHGLQLPVQNPATATDWRQEGSQPPLYYMLGAVLTSWIDTSDLDKVRDLNPHADIGIVVPDGNANMLIHDPALESFPWHGSVLAIHIVRFYSVALGALTVWMTYLLALELFPGRRGLALAAAAFTAFNPMFLFISGSVNNDNLSNALGCVLLLLIVRLVKRREAAPIRDLVLIGVVSGAGLLAKLNIGFMLPLVALALIVVAYRLRAWRPLIVGALVTGGLTILIAGWWYVRNQQLYGDPSGLNMMLQIVGLRSVPANLPQLWSERQSFLMSYWGFFGGVNVPMPNVQYTVFNALAALGALGLVVAAVRWIKTRAAYDFGKLVAATFTVIWIVILFVSLLRWTSITWASQGRLMFSAIAPLSVWMAVGLGAVTIPPLPRFAVLGAAVGWFVYAGLVLAPITIGQTYTPCNSGSSRGTVCASNTNGSQFWQDYAASFHEPDQPKASLSAQPDPILTLSAAGLLHPGDYLTFDEPFHVNAQSVHFSRNWSLFIHLENADGLIVAQRDVYPGQGQLPTSLMDNELLWYNPLAIQVPEHAYAPQALRVYLGVYDLQTGQRMIAQGRHVTSDNQLYLGTVNLVPRQEAGILDTIPNAMSVNLGGQAELVGYEVSRLVGYPAQRVEVTLYWRALQTMQTDYHVFAQVLQPNTSNVFGSSDAQLGTTSWKVGEIVKDEHTITLASDAKIGTWQLQVGMYQLTDDHQFQRLRIVTPDGGQADDAVQLTRFKITALPEAF